MHNTDKQRDSTHLAHNMAPQWGQNPVATISVCLQCQNELPYQQDSTADTYHIKEQLTQLLV
jgi:hypothetical protein